VDNQTNYINEHGMEIKIERRFYDLTNVLVEDYFENGNLTYRTRSENDQILSVEHFAFSVDQINRLIDKNTTISIIYRTWENGCEIDEYIDYKDKVVTSKRISVTNKFGDCICFRYIQLEKGEIKGSSTEKSFFENGELNYLFDYNPDGTCFRINNYQTDQEDISSWDIGTDKTNFTWKGFEYYQFADPLVPEK
jgi:hypothetical protein